MTLTVAILAGGYGTRLRPLTNKKPKAMIDVNGKPFIGHQLELLAESGIKHVILCTGHLGMQIAQYVGNGSQYGLHVEYSVDGAKRLQGTGGALRDAAGLGDAFFVLYGDAYLPCDYAAVEKAFLFCGRLGMMTVFPSGRGNTQYANGQVTEYNKTITSLPYIDYGLSVLSKQAIHRMPREGPYDLGNLYLELAEEGQMAGYEMPEPYHNIGSPSGLLELRRWLRR